MAPRLRLPRLLPSWLLLAANAAAFASARGILSDDDLQGAILLRGAPRGAYHVPLEVDSPGGTTGPKHDDRLVKVLAEAGLDSNHEGEEDEQNGDVQLLLHTDRGHVESVMAKLQSMGLAPGGYIPHNTVLLLAPRKRLPEISRVSNVRWIGTMRNEWKHAPNFFEELETHVLTRGLAHLHVTLAAPIAEKVSRDWAESRGWEVGVVSRDAVIIRVDLNTWTDVTRFCLSREHVHWLSLRRISKFKNKQASLSVLGESRGLSDGDSGGLGRRFLWDKGLDGTGQVIGIHDTGLDRSHCFFRNDQGNTTANDTLKLCKECQFSNYYEPSRAYALWALEGLNATFCSVERLGKASHGGQKYVRFPNGTGTIARPHNVSFAHELNLYLTVLTGNQSHLQRSPQEISDIYCPKFATALKYKDLDFCCKLDPKNETAQDVLPTHLRALALTLLSRGRTCCPTSLTLENMGEVPMLQDNCTFTTDACTKRQTEQRKVQAYWAFADTNDKRDGHGTHVSGSVAGSAATPGAAINAYQGMAPKAKIVFSDASRKRGYGVWLPVDEAKVMKWAYDLGARIHTNSWGDSSNTYEKGSQMFDEAVYERKDLLILFAAGNDGDQGYASLGSQPNSKNVLTVGAASQPLEYELQDAVPARAAAGRWELKSTFCEMDAPGRAWASGRLLVDINSVLGAVCHAMNQTFHPFSSAHAAKHHYCPKISDENWAQYVCRVNAFNFTAPTGDCRDGLRRLAYAGHSRALPFRRACAETSESSLKRLEAKGLIGERRMAWFSSRGPTEDGRIKPDVSAPGYYVVSSRADANMGTEQCAPSGTEDEGAGQAGKEPGLLAMAGTSMATPITAGSVALVRQYYTEGWHLSGRRNTSAGLEKPSAALLKATVIAAAVPVQGTLEFSRPYDEFPDGACPEQEKFCQFQDPVDQMDTEARRMVVGFGFLHLPSALWFEGDSHRLYVIDSTPRLQSEDVMTLKMRFVNASASAIQKAVLVWTDPPAMESASKTLVNDLDLTVQCYDESWGTIGKLALGNGGAERDTRNNVEVVESEDLAMGGDAASRCEVRVKGANVNVGKQDFALVVLTNATATLTVTVTRAKENRTDPWRIIIIVASVMGSLSIVAIGIGLYVIWRKWKKREYDRHIMHEMLPAMEIFGSGSDEDVLSIENEEDDLEDDEDIFDSDTHLNR